MNNKHIMVVEDETDILELISYTLRKEGYEVTKVSSGNEVLPNLKTSQPDLILLDIMLPGQDGIDLCRKIKSLPDYTHVPIIMLTAKSEEADVVTGLEIGADDYITKPFSPKILIARIRTALRRGEQEVDTNERNVLKLEDIVMNLGKHHVSVKNEPVQLTHSEFNILRLLCSKPGWVFSRAQIVNEIRGHNYAVTDRSIDVQIVGLRKKLHESGKLIKTVRGVGYKIEANA